MTIWNGLWREKQRNVNVFDLTAIGIGSSLAVGAFVVFGDLIKNVTGPAVLLSVALAVAAALLAGICFAELAVQFLKADTAYTFSYSFSNKHIAFVYGWALILEYAAGTASVTKGIISFIDALTGNEISNFLKDVTSTNFVSVFVYFDFLSFIIIAVLIIFLLLGIKDSTAVKNIFTLCNIVLVVSVIIAGSIRADTENWHTNESKSEKSEGGFGPFGILGVTKGAAIAFYGFVGFDNIGVSGSEVKTRKRNLPLSILTTVIATCLAYMGIGAILTLVLPFYKLNEHAAVPFAFEQLGWNCAKWIVAVATFFGFQTSLFGALFPLPRIIQAMANDGLLFTCLANNPLKINISKTAILFGGLLSAAATGILSFKLLVALTVLGALTAYTILAISIIISRYSRRTENDQAESWTAFVNENSIQTEMKNCFSPKETITRDLTKKVVMGIVIVYCLASAGLSVTYSVFSERLFKGSVEAVAPACLFLIIMLLSLFWLIRQPKIQTSLEFEVPFVPVLPCLSIFLNIFLMAAFDSITWILLSGWIVLGIGLHLVCQCLNCCNGGIGKDSLYEINKSNALKLNEAIWKINSEKKSFYEGAVNPVFTDETEQVPEELKTELANEIKGHNEKATLQLKQAELIQTAEVVLEEKTEPLEFEAGFVGVGGNTPEENNSVHWECVAEIHTEEEFPQESVVLEIVDDTYNFLSAELAEDNVSQKSIDKPGESVGSEKESADDRKSFNVLEETTEPPILTENVKKYNPIIPYRSLQDELFAKIKTRSKSKRESETEKEIISNQLQMAGDEDEFVNFVIETLYQTPKKEMLTRADGEMGADAEKETKVPDEHNRIKEFKEKLNQLLKNQISNGNPGKGSAEVKSDESGEANRKKSSGALFESIKTLNKTQIRGKLEVLLAKGPPKTPSFRTQFTNRMKKDEQTEKEKGENETDEGSTSPSSNDIKPDSTEVEISNENGDQKPLNFTETQLHNSIA